MTEAEAKKLELEMIKDRNKAKFVKAGSPQFLYLMQKKRKKRQEEEGLI